MLGHNGIEVKTAVWEEGLLVWPWDELLPAVPVNKWANRGNRDISGCV